MHVRYVQLSITRLYTYVSKFSADCIALIVSNVVLCFISFMSNQNASMFCREQSATLVISLESKRCSLHDKQLLERMLQKMQPSMSKPAPQPLQTDTHLCGAYAPEMLQPPRPAPQREPTALDPHKPCYMRFNPDSSSAPNASHHMTDSEFDRHVAADAATKIAWMMERRDLSSNEATALVDEHGEPVSRESHASLYNTVPQLLLPVCDSNLEMISVFAQVYAAARLPLGTVLFKQARRIGAVGPALDSALLQRAALDRLPCFASKSPSLQVQQQRQRISHITYHHAGSKLCLHPATSKMLLSKPFLNRDEHIRLTEHKTTSIGAQDYRAQFEHHVSKLLEPEVRSLQHVICSCSAASQQFCIQGADASKQLMRQASLDALDTWRRAFVLPQRHDMYHAYMDSQQFALRLAATLGSCPGSLHQDAWSREVALSFRSVLLAMPHLLGIAALDSTQFTPQRLSNWWLTADRTAHYIDHVSHRNEEHQVRNTQVGFQEFSLMRVFEEFDANARVAASAASVSMGLDSVECHRMLQTPSDPLTQADSAACRTPLQCLAVHASSMAMLQMSSNAGAANPPSQSPPSLTLSTSGKSSAMRAHRPFDARFDTLHSSPMNQPLLASSPLASYLPFSPWLDALSRHSVLSTSSPLSNSAMARSTFHMISQHTSSN